MHEPPVVSLRQRICRSEDTVIHYVKLVGLCNDCAQTDDQRECHSFHNSKN